MISVGVPSLLGLGWRNGEETAPGLELVQGKIQVAIRQV